jgi:hypothetical protein
VIEFSSDGQGPDAKNSSYPVNVRGAPSEGGFVAAASSEWNDVSAIQTTGRTKRIPTIQAATPSREPAREGLAWWGVTGAPPVDVAGRAAVVVIGRPLPGTASRRSAARTWR